MARGSIDDCALIEFRSPHDAERAIEKTNGQIFDGKNLKVSKYIPSNVVGSIPDILANQQVNNIVQTKYDDLKKTCPCKMDPY